MQKIETKWMNIICSHDTGKTKVFTLFSKDGAMLGEIRWYGPWRKYAFMPKPNTVFEIQCLADIIAFIDYQMKERKKQKVK